MEKKRNETRERFEVRAAFGSRSTTLTRGDTVRFMFSCKSSPIRVKSILGQNRRPSIRCSRVMKPTPTLLGTPAAVTSSCPGMLSMVWARSREGRPKSRRAIRRETQTQRRYGVDSLLRSSLALRRRRMNSWTSPGRMRTNN